MQNMEWLPLTEYALRSGISISTLRRKIKSNTIEYRMEEGRYLIRYSAKKEPTFHQFVSDDAVIGEAKKLKKMPAPIKVEASAQIEPIIEESSSTKLVIEPRMSLLENDLKWRALEARVSGMAKKMDFLSEQLAELKMLVKIFEERLDQEKF